MRKGPGKKIQSIEVNPDRRDHNNDNHHHLHHHQTETLHEAGATGNPVGSNSGSAEGRSQSSGSNNNRDQIRGTLEGSVRSLGARVRRARPGFAGSGPGLIPGRSEDK